MVIKLKILMTFTTADACPENLILTCKPFSSCINAIQHDIIAIHANFYEFLIGTSDVQLQYILHKCTLSPSYQLFTNLHTYHTLTKSATGKRLSATGRSYTGNGIQPVED